jgi:hypothetical protein
MEFLLDIKHSSILVFGTSLNKMLIRWRIQSFINLLLILKVEIN